MHSPSTRQCWSGIPLASILSDSMANPHLIACHCQTRMTSKPWQQTKVDQQVVCCVLGCSCTTILSEVLSPTLVSAPDRHSSVPPCVWVSSCSVHNMSRNHPAENKLFSQVYSLQQAHFFAPSHSTATLALVPAQGRWWSRKFWTEGEDFCFQWQPKHITSVYCDYIN